MWACTCDSLMGLGNKKQQNRWFQFTTLQQRPHIGGGPGMNGRGRHDPRHRGAYGASPTCKP